MRAATAAVAAAPVLIAAAVAQAPRRWVTAAATASGKRDAHPAAAPAPAATVRNVGLKLEVSAGAPQGTEGLRDSSSDLDKQRASQSLGGVPRGSSNTSSSSSSRSRSSTSRSSGSAARAFQNLLLNVHDVAEAPPGRLGATAKAAASQRRLNCKPPPFVVCIPDAAKTQHNRAAAAAAATLAAAAAALGQCAFVLVGDVQELWSAVCRRAVSLEKGLSARDAVSLLAAAAAAQRLLMDSKQHQPPQQHQQLLLQHTRMTQAAAAALSRAFVKHQQQQQAAAKQQQQQQQQHQQQQAITPTVLTTALHAFAALQPKDNEMLQQLVAAAVSLHLGSFSGYDLTSFCCSLVTAVQQQQQQQQQQQDGQQQHQDRQHPIQHLSSLSLQLETLLVQHLTRQNAASYKTLAGLQHQLTCALARDQRQQQQQQQKEGISAEAQDIADGVLLLVHEEPQAVAAAWDRPPHRRQANLAALMRAVIELRMHRSQPLLLPLLLQAALLQLEEARARLALRGLAKTATASKPEKPVRAAAATAAAAAASAAAAAAGFHAAVAEEREVTREEAPLELLLCLSTCRDIAGVVSCLSLLQPSDVEALNAALHQIQQQQQQRQQRNGLTSISLAVSLFLHRVACRGLLHGATIKVHDFAAAAPTEAAEKATEAAAAAAAAAAATNAATAACAETWVNSAATHAAWAVDEATGIGRLLLLAADHASLLLSLNHSSSNEEDSNSSSSSSRRDTAGAHEFVSAAKIASSCNKLSLCGPAASTAAADAAAASPPLRMPHLPLAALLQLQLQHHYWAVLSVDQLAMCWRLYSQTAAACASAAEMQKKFSSSSSFEVGSPVSDGLMPACTREVGLTLMSLAIEPLRAGLAARLESAGLSHLSTCLEAVAACVTTLSGGGGPTASLRSWGAPGAPMEGTRGPPVDLAPLRPHLALQETAETLAQSLLQLLLREHQHHLLQQQQDKGSRGESREKELSSVGQLVAAVAALDRLAPPSAAAAVAAVARRVQQRRGTRCLDLTLQQCGVLVRALANCVCPRFQLRDAEMLADICGRLTGMLQQMQQPRSGVSGQLLGQLLLSLSQLSFTPAHIAQARGVHTPRQEAACAGLFGALRALLQQTEQQHHLLCSMGLQSAVNCLHALALCDFSWGPPTCDVQKPFMRLDTPQPTVSAAAGPPLAASPAASAAASGAASAACEVVGEQSTIKEEGSGGGGSTMAELFNLLLSIARKHLLPMLQQQQQQQPRHQQEKERHQSGPPKWHDLKSVFARLPAAQQQLTAAAAAVAAPRHQSLCEALQQENKEFLSVLQQHICCLEPCSSSTISDSTNSNSSSSNISSSSSEDTNLRGPPQWLLMGTSSENAARTPHLAQSALQRGIFAALRHILPASPLFVEVECAFGGFVIDVVASLPGGKLVAVEADGGSHFLCSCEVPKPQLLQQKQQQQQQQQQLQLWAADMHGNVYNSSTLLKHRLLRERGLPVVSVSAAEWKAASQGGGGAAQAELLLQKIQRGALVLCPHPPQQQQQQQQDKRWLRKSRLLIEKTAFPSPPPVPAPTVVHLPGT
ncbi:hypothetical protein ACSSS7_002669 [Eimeria intestinalis]